MLRKRRMGKKEIWGLRKSDQSAVNREIENACTPKRIPFF